MSVRNVTILTGDPIVYEDEKAIEVITPGHLIEYSGAGVRKHATAAGNSARMFAMERDELGKDIADAYAINDQVKYGVVRSGQRVFAIASGTPAKGEFLESDGAGQLRKTTTNAATADTQRSGVIAVALETGANGVKFRVQIC